MHLDGPVLQPGPPTTIEENVCSSNKGCAADAVPKTTQVTNDVSAKICCEQSTPLPCIAKPRRLPGWVGVNSSRRRPSRPSRRDPSAAPIGASGMGSNRYTHLQAVR